MVLSLMPGPLLAGRICQETKQTCFLRSWNSESEIHESLILCITDYLPGLQGLVLFCFQSLFKHFNIFPK